MKVIIAVLLFAVGSAVQASDPSQFYRDATIAVTNVVGGTEFHLAGLGDQGSRDATLLTALEKLESFGDKVTYSEALIAGIQTNHEHSESVETCNGISSATSVIPFVQCYLRSAQTDLIAGVSAAETFNDGTTYFTRNIPNGEAALQAAINDADALTLPIAGQLVPGTAAYKAMFGLRGAYGYLDYALSFAFAQLQATISSGSAEWVPVLAAINRCDILLSYMALGMPGAVGVFPPGLTPGATPSATAYDLIGSDITTGQWYNAELDLSQIYTVDQPVAGQNYLATVNVYGFQKAMADAWHRLDSGTYWMGEI